MAWVSLFILASSNTPPPPGLQGETGLNKYKTLNGKEYLKLFGWFFREKVMKGLYNEGYDLSGKQCYYKRDWVKCMLGKS